jgi:hypothetical protein
MSGWRAPKAIPSAEAKVSVAVREPYLYLLYRAGLNGSVQFPAATVPGSPREYRANSRVLIGRVKMGAFRSAYV